MSIKSKLLNFKDCAVNSMIYKTYYDEEIDENLVYLESRDGLDFTGNIFRIVEELSNGDYGNLKIYVHAKKEVQPKIRAYQKNYNLKIDKIITKEATATKILEKAKYIFSDSGIRPKYVKRQGQIFINTFHGTPLKLMGFDNVAEEHRIGNLQHPFLSCDYLLYPNDFMCEKMLNAFMIEKIYPGKLLLEGYPRNSVFFDEDRRNELKDQFGFTDKEIFVYMPTYRGIMMDRDDDKQKDEIDEYLTQIDEKLKDNQVLLVKLHHFNQSRIDFTKFSHVMVFPQGFETYDVLNTADILITDYSSVFFDFANTRRKIILFNYDEDDYMSYRGTYFPLDDLPFPKVQTVDDLVGELNSPKGYDDGEFLERFCTYDRPGAGKYLCEHIFKGKKVCQEETVGNGKENILIFAGALYNNGIRSALLNLLNNVDRKEYNYFISYNPWDEYIVENHEEIFAIFPDDIEFLPFRFNLTPTVKEKMDYNKYFLATERMDCPQTLRELFKRSFRKQYPNLDFKIVIDFDGYNKNETLIFANSGMDNAVWVHNDMVQEIRTRGLQNLNVLSEAYSRFDKVCVVSERMIEPTVEISGRKDNIRVVHNVIDHEKIIERSKLDIEFDEHTLMHSRHETIEDVLASSGLKFISIGRFSPEKGHERLIKAFNEFCNDHPDSQLIIIGGHGDLYDDTVKLVGDMEYSDNITLINGISNPMPILKQCDLFILPSYYEGWGIVVMEADILEVPVIATDIDSLQWIKEYDGNLIDNSQEGILKGMYDFVQNKYHLMNIDYGDYDNRALDEFETVIKSK